MALFGKKKKDDEPTVKRKGKSKTKKKKKSSGIFEKVPAGEDAATIKRHQDIRRVWEYSRIQIDKGIEAYMRSGDTQILQEYMGGIALKDTIEKLDSLKAAGVIVSAPNRPIEIKQQQIEIIDERLDANGSPEKFTVREHFRDNTVFSSAIGQQQADGKDKILQATVHVTGQDYRIVSLIKVQGAFN